MFILLFVHHPSCSATKKYLLGGGAGEGWTALWSRGEGAHQEEETFRIQDTEEN